MGWTGVMEVGCDGGGECKEVGGNGGGGGGDV